MGKKKKNQEQRNIEPHEEMEKLTEETEENLTEGEPFDAEKHGVPGLDEMAMRLQVPPAEDPNRGIVLWGKSGRVYSWVDILSAHLEFTSQAVIHMANTHEKVNELLEKVKGEMKDELNKRSR